MRKLVFIFILSIQPVISGLYAQALKLPADTAFFYLYGGTNFDEARSIKELPGGGYILAGTTSSFGQGNTSVYLIKTDSMGKHLWSAPFGGAQNDWGYSVEVTADSGYFVAGYSNSFNPPNGYDAYYFKTDKNGNLLWQKTVSGYDWDFIYGSTPMPDGGFILCGETYTNSNGGSDAYLIRINKNGDTLWTNHYGGLFDEKFKRVSVMFNQIYAVGLNKTYAADTISDGWIVKLDTNGKIIKEAFISGPNRWEEIVEAITPYRDSLFHLCGKINLLDSGSVAPFIYRVDTALNLTEIQIYPDYFPGSILAFNQIVNISYGTICMIGYHNGGIGGLSCFVMGIDANMLPNGSFHDGGGNNDEYGYDGLLTQSGKVFVVGSSLSNSYYCPTAELGIEDVYLERFNTDSIINSAIVYNKAFCFADTLFIWYATIHYYDSDIQLKLFPNPVNSHAQLEINFNGQKTFTAKVFSILGTEVMSFKVFSNSINTLNASQLSGGAYFIKLQDESGNNLSAIRFIKSD